MVDGRILHGCDYNPEQWLHRSDILERDIVLMQEAGITMVSLGVFAWSHLEPREGEYDFGWLDETFQRLHGAGILVCLATATAAPPVWMVQRYPEVARSLPDGTREVVGKRHNFCWNSAVFREKSSQLISRLAQRYAQHPALVAWHINNEYGGNKDANRCYCATCIGKFQQWLRQRYSDSLDALNRSWWTSFWSHRYSSWEQIVPGQTGIDGLMLNWLRFCTEQIGELLDHEIEAVRAFSDAPVTTNLHGDGTFADDVILAPRLDFVSYDNYPYIDGSARDRKQIIEAGWEGDRMRGLLNKPWMLLESCPTQPQYVAHMRAKRPGVHHQLSMQHLGHGSEGVCYFQWRAGQGGLEKLHGAICMWDAPEHTRVFSEVAQLGDTLKGLGALQGSGICAKVAILWDVHTQWHFDFNNGLVNIEHPRARALHWYTSLWEANIAVDIVSPRADLSRYQLILMPGVFMVPEGFCSRLRQAVQAGATVVSDALSGWLDEDHCMQPGGRLGPELRELFGISCEEFDCLRSEERVAISSQTALLHDGIAVGELCDIVTAHSAEVLASYAGEFYKGRPCLTLNRSGAGRAYYLCATLHQKDLDALLAGLCKELSIQAPLAGIGAGVQVRSRVSVGGEQFFIISNYSGQSQLLPLPPGCVDVVDTARPVGQTMALAAAETRVVMVHKGTC
jgi:beta-galactosidase